VIRSSLCSLVVVLAGVVGVGCSPVGQKGDPCDDAPCAPGLICTDDGLCDEAPPPPPPPCVEDSECVLDGDASGRVCDDGVCRFDDCATDAQCGTRICVEGTCAPRIPCVDDDQCDGGDLCIDNACRPPCRADDDCGLGIGGFGLQACVEGRCLQRCLGDGTCLGGGLCEDNVCVEPECAESADCGDGNVLCDGGRCTTFTPCATDDECFDPNLECAVDLEPARCIERPLCRSDGECGAAGICLELHCRPAEVCAVDDDCARDVDECVGGRCVRAPACRSGADCAVDERCVNLACVPAPAPAAAARIDVADAFGPCRESCRRLLFVGERLDLLAQGYDDAGLPIEAELPLVVDDDAIATVEPAAVGAVVTAVAPGTVTLGVGGVVIDVVVVAPAGPAELVVAVAEADGAAPPAGLALLAGGSLATVDAVGVARVADLAGPVEVMARAADGRGVGVVGLEGAGTTLRLPLPSAATTSASTAPLSVTVTSTGDETGPVGLGLVLPSVSSPAELTLGRLLGDVVQAPLTLPIIGELPVGLPSAMTAEATLQFLGAQNLRERAEVIVAPGPAFVLAIEDRREQDVIVNLAFGGDPLAFALELLGASETADVAIAEPGLVDARDAVPDAADRDGDGNTAELIPDFGGAPLVDVRPGRPPQERGAVAALLPEGAVAGVVVAGFVLPGRIVPAGASVLRGLVDGDGAALPESFKAVPAPAGLARARRSVAVVADFGDEALSSRAFIVGDALPVEARAGALLAPPTGARLLLDLPAPGDATALLPTVEGADLLRLRLRDEDGVVDLYAAPTASLTVPKGVGPAALQGLDAFVVGGLAALSAGQPGAVDVVATKAASAPAE
jgi:hypothetical protein